jgi:hypothetical protein
VVAVALADGLGRLLRDDVAGRVAAVVVRAVALVDLPARGCPRVARRETDAARRTQERLK